MKDIRDFIENVIFFSRWILIPFYLGLIVVLFIYTFVYTKEVYHLICNFNHLDKNEMMLIILETVDIVMIANLVKMIITGSYNSFVSKDHKYKNENASSGILKVKMGTSLIGVSSIHLLKSFINASKIEWDELYKQLWIHGTFLVGAVMLAFIEYIHIKGEKLEHAQATH